ncbi:glycerol kinase GlpK [Nocardioides bruguierae]|uniref:glycerol kinase n=1 Tax=Nocardioides bruguierae TaxID=2945102 RepID=A0A9X2D556_9ACTN|nr:glycerol kinase GlpK [Nocardioides bruguierae]MCM0619632.1 glycerol kinase GlpK [Nocardioides bruguierae]
MSTAPAVVRAHAGRFVAAVDQGTTSTRCLVFDHGGRVVSAAQSEHRQSFPRPGWAEVDALEIWRSTQRVVNLALARAGIGAEDVAALGLANQRETTVVWDRRTGRPVAPAITWQDTRATDVAAQVAAGPDGVLVEEITGLRPAGYFSAPRLHWLLEHVPGLERRARAGEVLFGTMETWLAWNITGGGDGGVHVTDVTNAHRTLLVDERTLEWDPRLLEVFGVPAAMLPAVRPNVGVVGTCRTLLPGVPLAGAFGDQQAALFGQACFDRGQSKCTYGTGAFLLANTGGSPVRAGVTESGLLSTVAYQLDGEEPQYAVEASIAYAGALVSWFRDSLGLLRTAPEVETLARQVEDNGGCYVVPAFAGLFSPLWDPDARGVVAGLTSYVTKAHLARAVLEATAWQTYDVVEALATGPGLTLDRLRVDGGMTANNLLMQTIADVLDVPVDRPLVAESVSRGAAYAAGLAVGFWPDLDVLRGTWRRAASWTPEMSADRRRRELAGWRRAVERTLGWVVPDEAEGTPPLLL